MPGQIKLAFFKCRDCCNQKLYSTDICCGEAKDGFFCKDCCRTHGGRNLASELREEREAAGQGTARIDGTSIAGSKIIRLDTGHLKGKLEFDFSDKNWPCAKHASSLHAVNHFEQVDCHTCDVLIEQGVAIPNRLGDGLESVPGGAGFVRPTKPTPSRRKDADMDQPSSGMIDGHIYDSFKATEEMLKGISVKKLDALIHQMRGHKGTIFICGNGGCASISNHLAMELSHVARSHKAVSLSSDPATLTSLANDHGAENIFQQQLENLSREGDWLWCFSGSGTSANLLRAAEWAKNNGVRVFGFSGPHRFKVMAFDHLEEEADFSIRVPSAEQQHCEIGLMFIAHTLAYAFMEE